MPLLLLLLLSVWKVRIPQLEYDNKIGENADFGCLHDAESVVGNLFPPVT